MQVRNRFNPWFRKIPWKRARQPTLVFLSGESHGQRSPANCSPQGHTESDTRKRLNTQTLKVSETKISHISSLIFCISLPEFQVHLHLLLFSVPVSSSIKARVTLTVDFMLKNCRLCLAYSKHEFIPHSIAITSHITHLNYSNCCPY